jgi:hypothetical protein
VRPFFPSAFIPRSFVIVSYFIVVHKSLIKPNGLLNQSQLIQSITMAATNGASTKDNIFSTGEAKDGLLAT